MRAISRYALAALVVSLLPVAARLAAVPRQDDFTPAVLSGSYPAEIRVNPGGGTLDLWLTGKYLYVTDPAGQGFIANSRQMYLLVRHSNGGAWQPLGNAVRRGYNPMNAEFDPPASLGNSEFEWWISDPEMMFVSLPLATWAKDEGFLEFKVVKGTMTNNPADIRMLIDPKSESNGFRVPVKKTLTTAHQIDSFAPEYYIVNDPNPQLLTVFATYGPQPVLLIDGVPVKTVAATAPPDIIQVEFPPALLAAHGSHTIRIRDQQNSPSYDATIWVYGPPKGVSTQPQILQIGLERPNVDIKFTGQAPARLEARVSYVYDLATSVASRSGTVQSAAKIPAKAPAAAPVRAFTAPAPARGVGIDAETQASPWTQIPFTSPDKNRVRFQVPAGWLKQRGTVRVKLTGEAGSTELLIPIRSGDKSPVPQMRIPRTMLFNQPIAKEKPGIKK